MKRKKRNLDTSKKTILDDKTVIKNNQIEHLMNLLLSQERDTDLKNFKNILSNNNKISILKKENSINIDYSELNELIIDTQKSHLQYRLNKLDEDKYLNEQLEVSKDFKELIDDKDIKQLNNDIKRSKNKTTNLKKVILRKFKINTTKDQSNYLFNLYRSYKYVYNLCIKIHNELPDKDDKRKSILNAGKINTTKGKYRQDWFNEYSYNHLEFGIMDFHKDLKSHEANHKKKVDKAKWYIENIEGIEAYNISQGRLSTQEKIDKLNQENEIRINKFNEKMTKVKLEENRQELIIKNQMKEEQYQKKLNDIVNWKQIKIKEKQDYIDKIENVELKKKNNEIISFPIRHRDWKNGRLYNRKDIFESRANITKDTRIIYNHVKNFWYIIEFSTSNQLDDILFNGNVIALDPGVRTFQTGISTNGDQYYFGHEFRKHLDNYHKKIDKLNNLLSMDNSKKRKKRLEKRKSRLYYKIKNLTRELHYLVIKEILSKNDIVLLPHFESSRIILDLDHKGSKRQLSALEHYTFKQRLIHKANQLSKKVLLVSEHNSTKRCFSCKSLNSKVQGKVFECLDCSKVYSRDMNACRNIMYMNSKEINNHISVCV